MLVRLLYNRAFFASVWTMSINKLQQKIASRRVLAIISHPDAGKTTITEKLLLIGNLIQVAGTVKGKKSNRYVTSDWMTMEKQRGISVTSSVMQFPYKGCVVNLLDTPGHETFLRTLTECLQPSTRHLWW